MRIHTLYLNEYFDIRLDKVEQIYSIEMAVVSVPLKRAAL
jgi:hypothetical protein